MQDRDPSSYRLAAIDLDDTLLGPDKKISAANASAVHRLRERGVRITLASGRRHDNILRFHRQLDLDGPIVSCQGGFVKHAETEEIMYQHFVPSDVAAAVVADAATEKMSVVYYRPDGVYVRARNADTDIYERNTGEKVIEHGNLEQLAGDAPLKIIWVSSPEHVAERFPAMTGRYLGRSDVVITNPEYMEFVPHGVNKAVGVAVVASHYGIQPSHVMAFGDGNNDVALLEWAGLSVAMSHGRESAKAAADLISPDGDPATSFARAVAEILPR